MRRPPRLRARFATAGTGEVSSRTLSASAAADLPEEAFLSPFAGGLGVPRAAGSGEARDAGGACLLLGAIPRARRRGRCASGPRESGGMTGEGG